jgi:hypothetical protein
LYHIFDTEVAELFHDANIATIFHNVCFWIAHNKANGKNAHPIDIGGETVLRVFTFNSLEAFAKQFSYFSRRQIEGYLNKLRERNLIAKGNFNQKGFDRTSWYCLVDEEYWMNKYLAETKTGIDTGDENGSGFSEDKAQSGRKISNSSISLKREMHFTKWGNAFHQEGKSISAKGEMHITKRGNAFHQNVTPIPDSKPDINTDINHDKKHTAASVRKQLAAIKDPRLVFDDLFYDAAAEFLNTHHASDHFIEWLYHYIKKNPHVQNLRNYYYKTFTNTTLLDLFNGERLSNMTNEEAYRCPVCSMVHQINPRSFTYCDICGTPYNPTEEEIQRCKTLFLMEDAKREKYFAESLETLKRHGDLKAVKQKYGIPPE